jgi:GAF domain-containing protein
MLLLTKKWPLSRYNNREVHLIVMEMVTVLPAPLSSDNSPLGMNVASIKRQIVRRRRAEESMRRPAVRRHAARMVALVRTAAHLNAELDLDKVLTAVCRETAWALAVPMVTVSFYDAERLLLRPTAAYGLPEAFLKEAQPLPKAIYDKYHSRYGSLVVVPDVQALSELPNHDWYTRLDIRSTASATMLRENELVGRLNIATVGVVRHFSREDLALLQGLADQAALAICNAREVSERKKVETALAEEKRRLELLYNLSQNLMMTLNPREVGNRALNAIMTMFDPYRGEMYLVDEVGQRLRLIAAAGYQKDARPLLDARTEMVVGQGLAGQAAQRRLPVVLPRAANSAEWLPISGLDDEVQSATAVPLLAGETLVGVLVLLSDRVDFFTEEHSSLLGSVVAPMARALQNAQLYDAEQQARQLADRLRAVTLAVTEPLDFDTVLKRMLDQLKLLVDHDYAAVMLFKAPDTFVIRAQRHYGADGNLYLPPRLPQSFSLAAAPHAQRLLTERRGLIIADTAVGPLDVTAAAGRSWLGVPLLVSGGIMGALILGQCEPHAFNDLHLQLLEALAGQAVMALFNAQMVGKAQNVHEQLRDFTQQVVTAQEDEKYRLSYELHEEAGQMLSALQMNLSLIRADLSDAPESMRERLDQAVLMARTTLQQLQTLAQALRPPALDIMGLNLTLQTLCQKFMARGQLDISYNGQELRQLPAHLNITFYRFAQEALTNVVKHAQAQSVHMSLAYDGATVSLIVNDDGRGFDVEAYLHTPGPPCRNGLFGMQERFALLGGSLQIDSKAEHGTCLIARAPWQENL